MKYKLIAGAGLLLVLSSCTVAPTQSKSEPPQPQTAAVQAQPEQSGPAPTTRKRRHKRGPRGNQTEAAKNGSGAFDFYVMSLSWSPGFCATPAGQRDSSECGATREFGFVLHGLWPQYEQKGWPENCTTETVDGSTVNSMLNIMPSPRLVEHEWRTHGTCSGLDPKDYFEEATEAYQSVKIPALYQGPRKLITVSPDKMLHDFVAANPKFGEQGFAVLCSGNGRYLQEVRACLDKDLNGRTCNQEVLRDRCQSSEMIMRPVR